MPLARMLPSLFLVLCLAVQAELPAQLARDLSQPTDHRVLQDVSETDLGAAEAQGFRITDLEVASLAPLSFNAVLVANRGQYAADSWWFHGLSASEVADMTSLQQARLIDLDPYEVAGQARFAGVMVDNTGTEHKDWWWYQGTSSATIGLHAAQHIARLIDLDRYRIHGVEYFSAVMIANSSSDARGWWWLLGTNKAAIEENIQRNGSRVWDIDRNPDGSFDSILVLDRQPRHEWSWAIDVAPGDLQDLLEQRGQRLIDLETYDDNGPKLAVALIDNGFARLGSVENFGLGCGAGTPHSQSYAGLPTIAEEWTLFSQNARPHSPTALLLGFSDSSWGNLALPFDLGPLAAPGCQLFSSVQRSFSGLSDAHGVTAIQVPIPDDQGLLGFTFYTQFVSLDPTANALGLTLSDAAVSVIGNL